MLTQGGIYLEGTRLNGGHHYWFTVTLYLAEELYVPQAVVPGEHRHEIIDPNVYCEEAVRCVRDGLQALQFLAAHGWKMYIKGPHWNEFVVETKWTAHQARYGIELLLQSDLPGRKLLDFRIQPRDPQTHKPVWFAYEEYALWAHTSEVDLEKHYRRHYDKDPLD